MPKPNPYLEVARAAIRGYRAGAHPQSALVKKAREAYTKQARLAQHDLRRALHSRELGEMAHSIAHHPTLRHLALETIREEVGGELANFGLEVSKYARGSSSQKLHRLMHESGVSHLWEPVQHLLGRSAFGSKEPPLHRIDAAIKFLSSLGFKVFPPSTPTAPPRQPGSPASAATSGAPPASSGSASGAGSPPKRGDPNRGQPAPPGMPPRTRTPPPQGAPPQYKLPRGTFPGQQYVDMQQVGSSNVYAIGYNPSTNTMRVQYLASDISGGGVGGRGHKGRGRVRGLLGKTVTSHRSGPGPVYDYYNVPPGVFTRIAQAPSTGKSIWDNLRVRGTVYGHKFDYRLVAVSMNRVVGPSGVPFAKVTYVPRKAVGPGMFKARQFKQGSSVFKSLLPSQGV